MTCLFCNFSPLIRGSYTDVVVTDVVTEVKVDILDCPCCGEVIEGKSHPTGRTWTIAEAHDVIAFDPFDGHAIVEAA